MTQPWPRLQSVHCPVFSPLLNSLAHSIQQIIQTFAVCSKFITAGRACMLSWLCLLLQWYNQWQLRLISAICQPLWFSISSVLLTLSVSSCSFSSIKFPFYHSLVKNFLTNFLFHPHLQFFDSSLIEITNEQFIEIDDDPLFCIKLNLSIA